MKLNGASLRKKHHDFWSLLVISHPSQLIRTRRINELSDFVDFSASLSTAENKLLPEVIQLHKEPLTDQHAGWAAAKQPCDT